MQNGLKEKANKILNENLYMTISVANKSGIPWIANLYFAYDKDYNFYWYSPKDSLHSKMIHDNPFVALCIFDSTAVGNDVDALYIKAKAYEINNKPELVKGLILYAAKMLKTKFTDKSFAEKFIKEYQDFQSISKLRMYKAVPEKFWKVAPTEMFNNKFVDRRVEVKMK